MMIIFDGNILSFLLCIRNINNNQCYGKNKSRIIVEDDEMKKRKIDWRIESNFERKKIEQ